MKLNRLWSLLKQRKAITIMQGETAQWIGDGFACYPVYNLPRLTERVMQTLLDINDDTWDKFAFYEDNTVSFEEVDFDEEQIDLSPLAVELHYHGMDLMPLVGGGKILFIQTKYLKPFENTLLLSYAYRKKDGGVIAINEGLLLSAVIAPVDMSRDKAFEETLYKLYDLTKRNGGDIDDRRE